ncbi:MAG: ATPase, T2SS/T4P/T4SS family [Anaerolineales bacterium]|jgi:pilus assembly protein CpaF
MDEEREAPPGRADGWPAHEAPISGLPEGQDRGGLLEMMDIPQVEITASGEESLGIADEVIDKINHEFAAEVLRRPSKEDRQKVADRIAVLVRQQALARKLSLSAHTIQTICAELERRLLGLGFLDLLLPPARTDLTEIAVYSSGLVQVMRKGQVRWETVDISPSEAEIWRALDRILGPQNKVLNEANPSVNARLPGSESNPGGGRVKALHPVIAPPGRNPAVNIRLFEQEPVRPDWILQKEMASAEILDFLSEEIQSGEKILITGGTRTGKTTLLSALCNYLPEGWRIVKIEEPQEIWIDRPTVQTLEARPAAVGTEVKPYTLADGVDDALRLSPDYLIVGEVRDGRAALALFRALMTGHSGSCTFHADTPREALERLATVMGADAGVGRADAMGMIGSAIDLIVQLGIRGEVRRVVSVAGVAPHPRRVEPLLIPLFRFRPGSSANAPFWDQLPGEPQMRVPGDPQAWDAEMAEESNQ